MDHILAGTSNSHIILTFIESYTSCSTTHNVMKFHPIKGFHSQNQVKASHSLSVLFMVVLFISFSHRSCTNNFASNCSKAGTSTWTIHIKHIMSWIKRHNWFKTSYNFAPVISWISHCCKGISTLSASWPIIGCWKGIIHQQQQNKENPLFQGHYVQYGYRASF